MTGKAKNKVTGRLGEDIAAKFLVAKGYTIFARNIDMKGAEIDIIATKGGVVHLVEVKTISRESTQSNREYKPEDLVHKEKVSKIWQFGQYYLISREMGDREAQIDVITVELNHVTKRASCRLIEHAEALVA